MGGGNPSRGFESLPLRHIPRGVTVKMRPPITTLRAACLLVLLVALVATCCPPAPATRRATPPPRAMPPRLPPPPQSADTTTSTTTPPVTLSTYQKELAHTANVQNALVQQLVAEGVAQDDPRMALVFGLRARTQALSGRQALAEGDLNLARAGHDRRLRHHQPRARPCRRFRSPECSPTPTRSSRPWATPPTTRNGRPRFSMSSLPRSPPCWTRRRL